jgi:hypothetical protein
VVEASVLARLLGIRLLTLHATVLLTPADVRPPPYARSFSGGSRPLRAGGGGRRLADAVRNIDEGAAILDEARDG